MKIQNLAITELRPGMIIKDGEDLVAIDQRWGNQGEGLGIVVKGYVMGSDGREWEQRYVDPSQEVERVVSMEDDDEGE